jgi:DNA polymerase III delta prime subunit
MFAVDMTSLLDRQNAHDTIDAYVKNFYSSSSSSCSSSSSSSSSSKKNQKRGLYVFGKSGIGKSVFVKKTLEDLGYDVIVYDGSESRNKTIMESISNSNLSSLNIMSLFQKQRKKIVLMMDEIDGMNNGDRGGITSLIKLIRPKKTKKQILEPFSSIPVICIGNCHVDKKINELKKVCELVELKPPSQKQIAEVMRHIMPDVNIESNPNLISYIDCDLRRLNVMHQIYECEKRQGKTTSILSLNSIDKVITNHELDVKKNVLFLLNHKTNYSNHESLINDNDRTIVGLLYHENVVDIFDKLNHNQNPIQSNLLEKYIWILKNFCFADYVDRVIFQKQIWQLNEMSSLIKTCFNNHIIHCCLQQRKRLMSFNTIRFTKILTKYSTEYNNLTFVNEMAQFLLMEKKDIYSLFVSVRNKIVDQPDILAFFQNLDISNLDTLRMYRYIDKYTKPTNILEVDQEQEQEQEQDQDQDQDQDQEPTCL